MKTSIRYIGHFNGSIFKFVVECGTDEEAHLAKAALGQLRLMDKNKWLDPTIFVQRETLVYVSIESRKSVTTKELELANKEFEEILGRLAKINRVYELALKPVS